MNDLIGAEVVIVGGINDGTTGHIIRHDPGRRGEYTFCYLVLVREGVGIWLPLDQFRVINYPR